MSVSIMNTVSDSRSEAPSHRLWTAPEDRDALEISGIVTRFAADREIYAEGDDARCFYRIVSGVVRICRFLNDGRRQIGAFHMPGEIFGVEAGSVHAMAAEAVNDCTLVAYRRRGLEGMICGNDHLSRWFFSHAMSCLAIAREHSLLLARGSASQKIAAFLLEIAERAGTGCVAELPMCRQDIADYLGLTIETVSRTLSQMERDGIISLPSGRRVVLNNKRALPALLA